MSARSGELFAGVGGLGRAVDEVFGTTPAWFAEFDAAPSKVLAHHYPDIPNYGDVTKLDGELLRVTAPFQRRDDRAAEMYEMYKSGESLAGVAKSFGCSRQNVYDVFRWRDWPMRPRRGARESVEWNGSKWSLRDNGYYGRTTGARDMMHRAVWEHYNGPIPDGWDVHHKDRDRTNNDISNLACMSKSDHTKLHAAEAAEEVMPKEAPAVNILAGGFP